MKLYYLNENKKPVGPHSWDELVELKKAGVLCEDTLAAVAGDSKWRAFSELEKECSTWNNSSIQSSGEVNHTSKHSLWDCFVQAMKKYAVFKGRASRKEFWSFYLFYIAFHYAINIVTDLITSEKALMFQERLEELSEEDDMHGMLTAIVEYVNEPVVMGCSIVLGLYGLFMLVPFLSVSVRRLHDTGTRAWGVLVGCIANLSMMVSIVYFLYAVMSAPVLDEENIEVLYTPMVLMMTSMAILIFISIYLFIKMVLPGKKGENRFGQEPEY